MEGNSGGWEGKWNWKVNEKMKIMLKLDLENTLDGLRSENERTRSQGLHWMPAFMESVKEEKEKEK